jgi:hypothetical protein
MSTPSHDITEHDPSVLRAHAELGELQERLNELYPTRPISDAGWADRSAQLALIFARRAGWWRVLAQVSSRDGVHRVYRSAVITAESHDRDRARFWRESAQEWTARAQQRPTSDAAGALSNWHELGVTA